MPKDDDFVLRVKKERYSALDKELGGSEESSWPSSPLLLVLEED